LIGTYGANIVTFIEINFSADADFIDTGAAHTAFCLDTAF
jgi:hypothetical protein